jgi:hypothetical protein
MEDCELIGIIMVILLILFCAGIANEIGERDALAQKCAETQGRYDFCVQKVNWEVKE